MLEFDEKIFDKDQLETLKSVKEFYLDIFEHESRLAEALEVKFSEVEGTCHFCREPIHVEAIKCKHCREFQLQPSEIEFGIPAQLHFRYLFFLGLVPTALIVFVLSFFLKTIWAIVWPVSISIYVLAGITNYAKIKHVRVNSLAALSLQARQAKEYSILIANRRLKRLAIFSPIAVLLFLNNPSEKDFLNYVEKESTIVSEIKTLNFGLFNSFTVDDIPTDTLHSTFGDGLHWVYSKLSSVDTIPRQTIYIGIVDNFIRVEGLPKRP